MHQSQLLFLVLVTLGLLHAWHRHGLASRKQPLTREHKENQSPLGLDPFDRMRGMLPPTLRR